MLDQLQWLLDQKKQISVEKNDGRANVNII